MNIVLGITGSIAGYKALELIRLLRKQGAQVRVVLTKSALNFVTPLSCQTLSDNEVYIEQFLLDKGIKHLSLADWADIMVVAPATANIIAKAAQGIGDDLLSTTLLSFDKPILFVPAMDTRMWENRIVQLNIEKLKGLGYHFLAPISGPLASGKIGKGRFPEVSIIYKKIVSVLESYPTLRGMKILITGGRTEEDLDLVRVITNRSSGRMGLELLNAAVCREARVRAIFGRVDVHLPEGYDIIQVRKAEQLLNQLRKNFDWCDCLIMAAAVGDYRPEKASSAKFHSQRLDISFKKNVDLLEVLKRLNKKKIVVGFSLEPGSGLKRAREKLLKKGLSFIVHNPIKAIESEKTEATIVRPQKRPIHIRNTTKWRLANRILDECLSEWRKIG